MSRHEKHHEKAVEIPETSAAEQPISGQTGAGEGLVGDDFLSEELVDFSAEDLVKQLEQANNKIQDYWDKLVRAKAEMDNLRKRHERELEGAHKFGLERFANELLQVRDSLELGHQAAQGEQTDIDKLREGTELTLKLLGDVMNKFGIEQLDPLGEAFNPEFHQAMAMQPAEGHEANTVIQVVQRGYKLNGRLLRPAMVIVSQ